MKKLMDLLEDIFEADDSVPDQDAMVEMQQGQAFAAPADNYFQLLRTTLNSDSGPGIAALKPAAVRKLLKLVRQCSQSVTDVSPSKGAEGDVPTRLADINEQELGRLFRILERSIKLAEHLDPFPASSANAARLGKSSSKGAKARKSKSSKGKISESPEKSPRAETPSVLDENRFADDDERERSASAVAEDGQQELEDVGHRLGVAAESVLAAECCLAIMAGDQLPKPMLSEDLISACFDAIKTSLEKVLLPFVEACSSAAGEKLSRILTCCYR